MDCNLNRIRCIAFRHGTFKKSSICEVVVIPANTKNNCTTLPHFLVCAMVTWLYIRSITFEESLQRTVLCIATCQRPTAWLSLKHSSYKLCVNWCVFLVDPIPRLVAAPDTRFEICHYPRSASSSSAVQ